MESTDLPDSRSRENTSDKAQGPGSQIGRSVKYYLRGIIRLFDEKQVLLCSQAVAFKLLITWVPIAILATGFLGRVLSRDRPFQVIQEFVTRYFPSYEATRLIDFAEQLQSISIALTIVGSLSLVVVAISLLTTLRTVLAIVFRDDWHLHRKRFRGLLFDARMVVQVGVLFALTVALTTFVYSLDSIGVSILERFGERPDWLVSGWIEIVRYLSWFAPLLLSIGMFYQLYYFVPIPRPPRQSVLFGSLFAAALWEIGKSIFTQYATRVGRIRIWLPEIDEEKFIVLGDAFAIVVSFVMWAYFSGLILMLGAIIALLHERRHRYRLVSQVVTTSGTGTTDGPESKTGAANNPSDLPS